MNTQLVKRSALVLSGDENVPDMPLTESEINHLRRILAWIRCECGLDEHMMQGYLEGAKACVEMELTTLPRAQELVEQRLAKVAKVPAYVRQAVKMLTKAVRAHDSRSGVIDQ